MLKNIFVLFFSFLICFFVWRLFIPLDFQGETQILDVSSGLNFYKLAEQMEEKKLIRNRLDLKLLVKLFSKPHLLKGEYELSSKYSVWRQFQILRKGKDKTFLVHFPEGLNHYEMVQILKNHNWPASDLFLKKVWDKAFVYRLLKQDIRSLEGYLFPDSYNIKKYMTAEELIKMMFQQFLKVYGQLPSSLSERKMNRHQQVTFASLIEKETGIAEERALISGVFYNRLNVNMKLQTDPTVLYALYLVKGFWWEKNIRKKDLFFDSPYNTYRVKGLPPGPIANPGQASLRAVFFPEKSDYFYFVSRNDGSHFFSKTYEEHKKAVYRYQIKAFQKRTSNN